MIENYRLYGDSVAFDASYKMLKKLSAFGTHYGVGYFLGHDTNGRLIIFANCIFARDHKDYFKMIFEFFFDIVVQDKLPMTFVTDDFSLVTEAFEELQRERKYDISHIFNWFHVTNNIRLALRDDPNGEKIFYLFCRALSTERNDVYQKLIFEIRKKIKTMEILSDFVEKQHQYCLCKLPPAFVGFAIMNSYGRNIYERINTCTIFDSYAGRFFFTLLHTECILQRNMERVTIINDNIIKHIAMRDIHELQNKLEVYVMEKLVGYFN